MTPKYFAWLMRVRRVWWSFGRVRFGILYSLVKITSSVFSGLTSSPQTAVHLVTAIPTSTQLFPIPTEGRRKYDTFVIVIIVIPFDFY